MPKEVSIVQDKAKAIEIIKGVCKWLDSTGREVDDWWNADKMDEHFFDEYAQDSDFYVLEVDGEPAATAIIQAKQNMQDWSAIDGDSETRAIYIHYLCVDRRFAGQGYAQMLMDHAKELAGRNNIKLLRLDTNYDKPKLKKLYEDYGFKNVKVLDEPAHRTVLYELNL